MATNDSAPFPTSVGSGNDAGNLGTMSPGGMPSSGSGFANTGSSALNDSSTSTTGAAGNEVLQRVVQGAHETIDRLADRAAPVVNRLQDVTTGAGERLSVGADQVREMSSEWAESMRATVRENPLAAVGVALALGLLVARITR